MLAVGGTFVDNVLLSKAFRLLLHVDKGSINYLEIWHMFNTFHM